MNYSLDDLAAGREAAWRNVPACPSHYPQVCDCDSGFDGDGRWTSTPKKADR
jgi:hypothetical protein